MKLKNTYYCARFYITYRCNSKCSYCNVWCDPHFINKPELSLQEAKRLMRECAEIGVKYIDFTGGEPTLYPYLTEVIEYAQSLGIKTEVTSNCVAKALNPQQRLNQVAKIVDKFNISLDTMDSRIYHQVRGIDACNQVKQRIQEIATFRQPKIMTVISDANIKDLNKMIQFAQNNKSLIYLSPVFPYIDSNGQFVPSKYIKEITDKVFDPFTIVLLHFMEFFKNSDFKMIPPCSANKMTITLAPNGNLVLPCYHGIKEELPWNKTLKELVQSEKFLYYQENSSRLKCCEGCRVIPYMGISYSYNYDKYFLLQSYSEKLSQLKKNYLNEIYAQLSFDKKKLFKLLNRFVRQCHSLKTTKKSNELYYAEKIGDLYQTEIFKRPLTTEQHLENLKQEDCWHLKQTPVTFYNFFEKEILHYLKESNRMNTLIFQDVLEFQLRWWMYFIDENLNTKPLHGTKSNKKWLKNYLHLVAKSLSPDLRQKLEEFVVVYCGVQFISL